MHIFFVFETWVTQSQIIRAFSAQPSAICIKIVNVSFCRTYLFNISLKSLLSFPRKKTFMVKNCFILSLCLFVFLIITLLEHNEVVQAERRIINAKKKPLRYRRLVLLTSNPNKPNDRHLCICIAGYYCSCLCIFSKFKLYKPKS